MGGANPGSANRRGRPRRAAASSPVPRGRSPPGRAAHRAAGMRPGPAPSRCCPPRAPRGPRPRGTLSAPASCARPSRAGQVRGGMSRGTRGGMSRGTRGGRHPSRRETRFGAEVRFPWGLEPRRHGEGGCVSVHCRVGEDSRTSVGGGHWVHFWDGPSSESPNSRDTGSGGDSPEKGALRVEAVTPD